MGWNLLFSRALKPARPPWLFEPAYTSVAQSGRSVQLSSILTNNSTAGNLAMASVMRSGCRWILEPVAESDLC